jgi:hypothetical protein
MQAPTNTLWDTGSDRHLKFDPPKDPFITLGKVLVTASRNEAQRK